VVGVDSLIGMCKGHSPWKALQVKESTLHLADQEWRWWMWKRDDTGVRHEEPAWTQGLRRRPGTILASRTQQVGQSWPWWQREPKMV